MGGVTTTALNLIARGLEFVRNEHASIVGVRGPKPVCEEARVAVRDRVPSMHHPVYLKVPRAGVCDGCGDRQFVHRGGWCELCTLARRVALKAQGVLK